MAVSPWASAWEFDETRATAAWCAQHQTAPYEATFSTRDPAPEDERLYDGYTTVTISAPGRIGFAWHGSSESVWDIENDVLVYVRFHGGVPGGYVVAVNLPTGRERWAAALSHPIPSEGWSFWSNRNTIEIRGDRVHVWSEDNGRHHEVFDLTTGASLGRQAYSR